MSLHKHISFTGFAALLLYIFGIGFSFVVHDHSDHHEHEIVAYQEATSCERTIYYAEHNLDCEHDSHITASEEECWLCSDHTTSPHQVSGSEIAILKIDFFTPHFSHTNKFLEQKPSTLSNKGPPTV